MSPTAALALLVGLVYLALAVAVSWGKPLHCRCPLVRQEFEPWAARLVCRDCGRSWEALRRGESWADRRPCWSSCTVEDGRIIGHRQRVAYRSALRRWARAAWYVGAGFAAAWREVR